MSRKWEIAFSLLMVALFAAALVAALTFRAQARLFPMVISVLGLALSLLQLGLAVARRHAVASGVSARPAELAEEISVWARGAEAPLDPAIAPEGPGQPEVSPEEERRRTAALLGWIVGFVLAVWFVGFPLAVPILTLAYLRYGAGEPWPISVTLAIGGGALFYGVFVYAVRIPFDEGLLFTLLLG